MSHVRLGPFTPKMYLGSKDVHDVRTSFPMTSQLPCQEVAKDQVHTCLHECMNERTNE